MQKSLCAAVAVSCLVLLTGCQGTPIGDAMTGPEKLAEQDDAYCKSIGTKPGSNPYIQCRMFKTAQREENHRQAFARAGASMSAAGAQMQANAAMNRPVNCTSTKGYGGTIRTTCY